jgi:chemotaxis regulatin CheY-phosphate phosphatase CheZ
MGTETIPGKVDPEHLSTQLGTIVREIDAALKTIGALSGPLIYAQATLPGATESLSEVSSMTEEASQSILLVIEEQLEIQNKMREILLQGAGGLTASETVRIDSLLSQDQQGTLRVMGALGFQDLVQQNLMKIAHSIQIVENKLLEVLMLLHWEKGSRVDPEGMKLLSELYKARVGDPERQKVVDEILREYGV